MKHVEKLEITIHEMNVRFEELNRTVIDITSHKTRLSQVMINIIYFQFYVKILSGQPNFDGTIR